MRLREEPIRNIRTNNIRKLYLVHRSDYYEALMGGIILVPEGIYDYEWLRLWQRVAQSSSETVASYDLRPITVVPTSDAAVVETFQEVAKLRPDAIPVIDGDPEGTDYLSHLCSVTPAPARIIRFGDSAAVECLAAWILEPALPTPGDTLVSLLSDPKSRTLKDLQDALINKKKDRELRENLVWESLDFAECCNRACEFFHDLAAIAVGVKPMNNDWQNGNEADGPSVFTATYIKKA
jgi:hypothetical protein